MKRYKNMNAPPICPRHFNGTSAEMSWTVQPLHKMLRHFGTGAEVSQRHFGTDTKK